MPPRTRNRPTLSCLSCRRRKARCDQLLPCSTCVGRGQSAECEYAEGARPVRVDRGLRPPGLGRQGRQVGEGEREAGREMRDMRERLAAMEALVDRLVGQRQGTGSGPPAGPVAPSGGAGTDVGAADRTKERPSATSTGRIHRPATPPDSPTPAPAHAQRPPAPAPAPAPTPAPAPEPDRASWFPLGPSVPDSPFAASAPSPSSLPTALPPRPRPPPAPAPALEHRRPPIAAISELPPQPIWVDPNAPPNRAPNIAAWFKANDQTLPLRVGEDERFAEFVNMAGD